MWQGSVGLIVGILIGGFAVWMWLSGRVGKSESVESLKRDNQRFREEVNDHFVQTAELINQLTDSYKAVFDHLSKGAETLVEAEAIRERMPQVSEEEVVRLKRLGAPMSPASEAHKAQLARQEAAAAEIAEAAEREAAAADGADAQAAQDEASKEPDGTRPDDRDGDDVAAERPR